MDNNKTNQILEQALFLAEKVGWSIIPVGKNKKPLIRWEKYQTEKATKEQLTKWLGEYPTANIAVVTGKISNIIVIDIDPRHGATDEDFKDIQTVRSKTGGGGWHIYFQYEEGLQTKSKIKDGIDIRSDGGYAILPPSIHESGSLYQWEVEPNE